jgi:hypothetical protein
MRRGIKQNNARTGDRSGRVKESEPGDFSKSSLILFRLCDLIPTRFVRLWETGRTGLGSCNRFYEIFNRKEHKERKEEDQRVVAMPWCALCGSF